MPDSTHPAPRSDPHPYVHLTYGPWEPSGHQCADLQPSGCDDVPPERKITARINGLGDEQLVGFELGDCPSCGPGDLRDRLGEALDPVTIAATPAEVIARHMDGLTRVAIVPSPAAFDALVDAVLPVAEDALVQQATDIDEEIIKPERALHEETVKRAEKAERERDATHRMLERVPDVHMKFGVVGVVEPEDAACADWCYACRVERAEAAVARVRYLCELTIASSIRVQAIDQARDTLAALDRHGDGTARTVIATDALHQLVRVAAHVSRGCRAADADPYPDALARKALGALDDATLHTALEPPKEPPNYDS